MKKRFVLVAALLSALLMGCQVAAPGGGANPAQVGKRVEVAGGAFMSISVGELQSMLTNKDFSLVNVHIPYEGEIERTDLHIPYNAIEQNLDKLANKDARIVAYCRSGPMSATAVRTLVSQGYTRVYDVEGGMIAWQAAGLPLVRK